MFYEEWKKQEKIKKISDNAIKKLEWVQDEVDTQTTKVNYFILGLEVDTKFWSVLSLLMRMKSMPSLFAQHYK